MHYAYRTDAWQTLYTAAAGSAAALTGLPFTSLPLNLLATSTNQHRSKQSAKK